MCSHNTWKLQVKQIHVQKSNLSCELIWFLSSQSKTKSNRRVIKIMMQSRKWEKVKRDAQITMYNYKYKATNAECDTAWKRADNNSTRTSKIGSEFQPGGRKSGHVTFESMIIHQSQSFPHTTWLSQDVTWYMVRNGNEVEKVSRSGELSRCMIGHPISRPCQSCGTGVSITWTERYGFFHRIILHYVRWCTQQEGKLELPSSPVPNETQSSLARYFGGAASTAENLYRCVLRSRSGYTSQFRPPVNGYRY